jgi:hypothetical protein
MSDPLNRLCKWRSILAGWHAGSKSIEQDGAKAMRDLMDKWLIMRVETRAMTELMLRKGVITAEEWTDQVHAEAEKLDAQLAKAFPGFRTFDHGVQIYDLKLAQQTMREKGFPP